MSLFFRFLDRCSHFTYILMATCKPASEILLSARKVLSINAWDAFV
jgi:hypothetical protein